MLKTGSCFPMKAKTSDINPTSPNKQIRVFIRNVYTFLLANPFIKQNLLPLYITTWGSKGGAVVRALASHQCAPGSNPGVDAICGLSLLLVLSFSPRGFSPGTPVFLSP